MAQQMGTPETTSSQGSQASPAGRRPEQARPAVGSRAGARCAARPSRCAKPPGSPAAGRRVGGPASAARRLEAAAPRSSRSSRTAPRPSARGRRAAARGTADRGRAAAHRRRGSPAREGRRRRPSSAWQPLAGARRDRQLGCVAAARGREGRPRAACRRADSWRRGLEAGQRRRRHRDPRARTAEAVVGGCAREPRGCATTAADPPPATGRRRRRRPRAPAWPRASSRSRARSIRWSIAGRSAIGRRRRGPDAGARIERAQCASGSMPSAASCARQRRRPAQRGQGVRGAAPRPAIGARGLQRLREAYAKELQQARGSVHVSSVPVPGAGPAGLRARKRTSGAPPIRAPRPSSRTSRMGIPPQGRSTRLSTATSSARRPRRGAGVRRSPQRRRQRQGSRRLPRPDRPLLRIAGQKKVGSLDLREPASLVGPGAHGRGGRRSSRGWPTAAGRSPPDSASASPRFASSR